MPVQRPGLNYPLQRLLAVVTDITNINASPPTVQVQVQGDTSSTVAVGFLDTVRPIVGDMVVLTSTGPHHLITGWVNDGTRILQPLSGLSYVAGWGDFPAQEPVTFSRMGGLVTISGYLQKTLGVTVAGTTYQVTTNPLPAGFRPASFVPKLCAAYNTATSFAFCRITIGSAGVVQLLTASVVNISAGIDINLSYVAEA
jgi:hypothetical protein